MPTCKYYRLLLAVLPLTMIFVSQAPAQNTMGSSADADYAYAEKLQNDGFTDLAIAQYSEFVRKYPGDRRNPAAWRRIGLGQMQIAAYARAREAFESLLLRYPTAPEAADANYWIARCFALEGESLAAAQTFERFARFDPSGEKAPDSFMRAAKLYLAAGDFERGRRLLFEMIELYPENPELRAAVEQTLLEDYFLRGEYRRAFDAAEAFLAKFSDITATPGVWLTKARVLKKLGQFQNAQTAYETLQQKYPRTTEATVAAIELAELQAMIGNSARAQQILAAVRGRSTDSLGVAAALLSAQIYMREGNCAASREALQSVAAQAKGLPSFLLLSAQCSEKLADYAASLAAYEVLINQRSLDDSLRAVYVLAASRVALLAKQPESFSQFSASLQKLPVPRSLHPTALLLRAEESFTLRHDFARASRLYAQFLEDYPDHPGADDAQYQLALCYENLQDWPIARAEWQRLTMRYPASPYEPLAEQHLSATEARESPQMTVLVREFSSALAGRDGGADPALQQARILLAMKDYGQSVPLLKKSIAETPAEAGRAEALLLLGEAYHALGDSQWPQNKAQAQTWYDSSRVVLQLVRRKYASAEQLQLIDRLLGLMALRSDAAGAAAYLDSLSAKYASVEDFAPIHAAAFLQLEKNLPVMDSTGASLFELRLKKAARLSPGLAALAGKLQAVYALSLGDTVNAIQVLRETLKQPVQNKYHVDAELLLCRLLAVRGQSDEAMQRLLDLGRRHFYSPVADEALLLYARIAIATRQPARALDALSILKNRRQLEGDGWQPQFERDYHFVLARAYEKSNDPLQAAQAYLAFLSYQPDAARAPQALLSVAQVARDLQSVTVAKNYYAEAIKLYPESAAAVEAELALSELAFDAEDYAEARRLALQAFQRPADAEHERKAIRLAIVAAVKQGQISIAESDLKNFKTRYPQEDDLQAEIQYEIGEYYLRAKNFKRAEDVFKDLRKKRKETSEAIYGEFGLGEAYLIQNKFDDALEVLTGIPQKYPGHPFLRTVYLNLGKFYMTQQQWGNAVEALKKVLADSAADNTYKLALRQLIDVYEKSGSFEWAAAYLRQYLQRFPNDDADLSLRIKQGTLMRQMGQFDEAIRIFKSVKPFAVGEAAAEVQYYIADSYFDAGQLERAIAEYLRLKYYPIQTKLDWQTTALYKAGISYTRLRNYAKARLLFEEIVRKEGAESNFGRFARQRLAELDQLQTRQ